MLLGLYGGKAVGSGLESLTFDVTVNTPNGPKDLIGGPQTFDTISAGTAYFSDNAVDLGAVYAPFNGERYMDVTFSLSETFSGAGGFYAGLIVADPPPAESGKASPSGSAHQTALAQALFDGFFNHAGGDAVGSTSAPDTQVPARLAANAVAPSHTGHG